MLTIEQKIDVMQIESLPKNNSSKRLQLLKRKRQMRKSDYYHKTRVCKIWCMKKGNHDYYFCGKRILNRKGSSKQSKLNV